MSAVIGLFKSCTHTRLVTSCFTHKRREGGKNRVLGLNVPHFVITMLYCVYHMSLELKACRTAVLCLVCDFSTGPFL